MTFRLCNREELSEKSTPIRKFNILLDKAVKTLSGDNFKVYTILLQDTLNTELEHGYKQYTEGFILNDDLVDKTGRELKEIHTSIDYLVKNHHIWIRGDYSYKDSIICYIVAFENSFPNVTPTYMVDTNIIVNDSLCHNIVANIGSLKQLLRLCPNRPSTRTLKETEHWNDLRILMQNRRVVYCQVCATRENLVLHHRNYLAWGNESIEDVVWLCASCHGKVHNGCDANG